MLFRDLSPEEETEFREYAQENDPPNLGRWEIYHPVCREEWTKRGLAPQPDNPVAYTTYPRERYDRPHHPHP